MKIKVGDLIFSATDTDSSVPIMVKLSDADKRNIANMHPESTMYAWFPDGWGTEEQMESWMDL